jgi:hypothetical protein
MAKGYGTNFLGNPGRKVTFSVQIEEIDPIVVHMYFQKCLGWPTPEQPAKFGAGELATFVSSTRLRQSEEAQGGCNFTRREQCAFQILYCKISTRHGRGLSRSPKILGPRGPNT